MKTPPCLISASTPTCIPEDAAWKGENIIPDGPEPRVLPPCFMMSGRVLHWTGESGRKGEHAFPSFPLLETSQSHLGKENLWESL